MARHIRTRPLLVLLSLLVLGSLILNAVSQAVPRLMVAHNVVVAPTKSPAGLSPASPSQIDQFLAATPETRIGFWKQCQEDGGCTDLQLPCGDDGVSGSAAAARGTTADQLRDFASTKSSLCPRMNAARVLMAISIFAGFVALVAIALKIFMRSADSKNKVLAVFLVLGATIMSLAQLVSVILLATIKHSLDSLSDLLRALSPTGTSTPFTNITTVYSASSSFFVSIAGTVLAMILLPLVYVLALRTPSLADKPATVVDAPPTSSAAPPAFAPVFSNATSRPSMSAPGNKYSQGTDYYSSDATDASGSSPPQTYITPGAGSSSSPSSESVANETSRRHWHP
ncbi:uncharacterized protein EV422DRAFT_521918 [Fimicolochytrium jonesii]|uniref:uncharacterized protein n=1 Tax=Fimicolochytrium jonesii TaxID=1396493 RepID=UPI0022FDDDCB|nr:uncharacterized protein EV422DRAFT_521918 [Fimicolochytrium jonesii]KAI8823669.1 hypothetical protein EV422DRAFT_521918 [Fimicolochytrium jonesii]